MCPVFGAVYNWMTSLVIRISRVCISPSSAKFFFSKVFSDDRFSLLRLFSAFETLGFWQTRFLGRLILEFGRPILGFLIISDVRFSQLQGRFFWCTTGLLQVLADLSPSSLGCVPVHVVAFSFQRYCSLLFYFRTLPVLCVAGACRSFSVIFVIFVARLLPVVVGWVWMMGEDMILVEKYVPKKRVVIVHVSRKRLNQLLKPLVRGIRR